MGPQANSEVGERTIDQIMETIEKHGPIELNELLLRMQNKSEGLTKDELKWALRELAKRNHVTHTSNRMVKASGQQAI